MKKSFLLLVLFGISLFSFSQVRLETSSLNISGYNYQVIQPTVDNLIKIVGMDVQTFKSTMSYYNYHPDEENATTSYIYTNMSMDFFLDGNKGRGVNDVFFDPSFKTKFAGVRFFNKNLYPRTCIQDLYQQLSNYYTKTEGGIRKYALTYNGYNYGLCIIANDQSVTVQIYKFEK